MRVLLNFKDALGSNLVSITRCEEDWIHCCHVFSVYRRNCKTVLNFPARGKSSQGSKCEHGRQDNYRTYRRWYHNGPLQYWYVLRLFWTCGQIKEFLLKRGDCIKNACASEVRSTFIDSVSCGWSCESVWARWDAAHCWLHLQLFAIDLFPVTFIDSNNLAGRCGLEGMRCYTGGEQLCSAHPAQLKFSYRRARNEIQRKWFQFWGKFRCKNRFRRVRFRQASWCQRGNSEILLPYLRITNGQNLSGATLFPWDTSAEKPAKLSICPWLRTYLTDIT